MVLLELLLCLNNTFNKKKPVLCGLFCLISVDKLPEMRYNNHIASKTEQKMTTATYTFDENIVSDLHKDAYGRRPCQNWWADWGSMNAVGKQQEWDSLIDAMEHRENERKEDERVGVLKFEANVAKTVANGAADRTTAIRWMMDAEGGCNGDTQYFEFLMGVPYGYTTK